MRVLACLILLFCAACAGGPKAPAPPLSAVSLTDSEIDGAPLALSQWQADAPKAVILALHGFGDYAPSTFAKAAPYWAKRGFTVYAYDQRGHGRNADNRVWPGADTLIADAAAITKAVRALHPGLPLYLLGHSMGGGVALAAANAGADIDGLILAAPAVWGGKEIALPYRAAAWAGALVLPDKRWTGEGVVTIQASDNIPVLRRMGRDPLVIGAPSSREFMGLIRIMDRAVKTAPRVTHPTLVLYGEKDEVTPPAPVDAAFEIQFLVHISNVLWGPCCDLGKCCHAKIVKLADDNRTNTTDARQIVSAVSFRSSLLRRGFFWCSFFFRCSGFFGFCRCSFCFKRYNRGICF